MERGFCGAGILSGSILFVSKKIVLYVRHCDDYRDEF